MIEDKIYLIQFAESDEFTRSKLYIYDVSKQDGLEFTDENAIKPEKIEILVELTSHQDKGMNRVMPLNNQGKFAVLSRDSQHQ